MQISYDFTLIDVFVIIFGAVLAIVFCVAYYLKKKNKQNDNIDRQFLRERWRKIEDLLELKHEMNYKLAVIEADKILEDVLKSMYFPGESTAERLKVASYKFPKLRHVWWAHKVRNMCVHDLRYTLKYSEAQKVIGLFKNALKVLNIF